MLVDTSSLKLCNVMKGMVLNWRSENVDAEMNLLQSGLLNSAFLRVYEYTIHPLNDNTLWPHMLDFHHILPPIRRRLPGRPCVKRKRDQAENKLSGNTRHAISRAGVQHRCTICNEVGHNKATYPMRGPSEAGPSKTRKKSNARNCPSQAGPSTPDPSAPTHVNQDPLTQDHVPVNQENVNEDPVNQEKVNEVPVNQDLVNEVPVHEDPVNEVPINQDPVIPVPVNQVPVNLGVRVPRRLGVRARKPS
uniref:Uncharacterized protein n=1 Tax=Lactuca sativa TaxID=4236 RepID=A0A9R1VU45_LACSA|nr:hypothetical protein LSAT_V11C400184910 [Lactuca sativa]